MEKKKKNHKNNIEMQVKIIVQAVARIEKKVDKVEIKIDESFAAMNERFNGIDERFNAIDERLNHIEGSIGRKQQEIDELRDRGRILETRVDKMEIASRD